jgi:uncharacterized protein (TIGR02145 family)
LFFFAEKKGNNILDPCKFSANENNQFIITMMKNVILLLSLISLILNGCTKESDNSALTDQSGNTFTTVTIGTQVWMKENLKATNYQNGDQIPNVTDNSQWANLTTGAYAAYGNVSANASIYGLLYNWYAVSDSRNICPAGWHVPTDSDWATLATFLGGEGVAGAKLKESGITHWESPNSGATNSSGFTAIPGGIRYNMGTFGMQNLGAWWSSTATDASTAYERDIVSYQSAVIKTTGLKKNGYSVRCVKD